MSDLSDWYGGGMNHSPKELLDIKRRMKCISDIEKMSVGLELVERYRRSVKKSRREFLPMEDWIRCEYNRKV